MKRRQFLNALPLLPLITVALADDQVELREGKIIARVKASAATERNMSSLRKYLIAFQEGQTVKVLCVTDDVELYRG